MAAALEADEPGAPIEHRRCGAVSLGHLDGVGLDLVLTILAPDDKAELGSGGATQRHRRARFEVFKIDRRLPWRRRSEH